jgi:hypothetical protein
MKTACITTDTVEGYFGIIKRGIDGIYHHVGKAYLDQYLPAFRSQSSRHTAIPRDV